MGNKFGCDITCRAHSFFENEMSFKPIKSELIGSSLKDEGFIEFNSLLHNQNFSANYFKAKSLSKSLKTSKNLKNSKNQDSEYLNNLKVSQTHLEDELSRISKKTKELNANKICDKKTSST